MKCHPEYLTSEWLFRCRISAREMVNASRHTFNLLSDPLQRFSKTRGRSEEVNINPELFCFVGGANYGGRGGAGQVPVRNANSPRT